MHIRFHKLSEDRHALEIIRADGSRDVVECETRSFLLHDFLHFVVEAEAKAQEGFWGRLAKGTSFAEMKEGAARELSDERSPLAILERAVGAMHSLTKGRPASEVFQGLTTVASSSGIPWPPWLTEGFVAAVQNHLRQLTGRWKATPFGAAMPLEWD